MINVIDFEVFKCDWLCVINNPVEKTETVIVNDVTQLQSYYDAHKDEIFVGHNIRNYDQWIFKGILCGFNPKEINDYIILQEGKGWAYSTVLKNIPLNVFDTMPALPTGLKTLEGFMGSSIEETTVSFDIDRKLNAAELAEVIKYCKHDVDETLKVFLINKAEFDSQFDMIKTFNLPFNQFGKTKPQLSAMVLGASMKKHTDEWNFVIPETAIIKRYTDVLNWYKDDSNKDYSKKLEIDIAGVPHIFAWGGLHGAIPQYQGEGYFVNVDVASYYPSLMIRYNYISRNVSDPNKYSEIYHKRLEYKKAKDKRQAPLKIVLNSTYGAMKDKNNPLFDPLMANNVCIGGQILLLDLIEKLEDRFDIIQSNTDGILVKLRANNEAEASIEYSVLDDICFEWEQRTGMNLEFDEFRKVVQKDVNNYVIIDAEGHYKSKGAYVKKLNDLDNDLPIINEALINRIVHNVPVEETINRCNELKKFQKIVKLSNKYDYAMHGNKRLNEKYFRVFASKAFELGGIFKVKDKKIKIKYDSSIHGDFSDYKKLVEKVNKPEKFANTPENCFIFNADVNNEKVTSRLDKQWYIDLAKTRLEQFGISDQIQFNI